MAGNAPHIAGCRDLSLIGERVARSLFAATSDRIGGPVTVAVFPPLSEGRTYAEFDRAAAVAQRLGAHPSVLTIHEWGQTDDGRPWVITDPQPAESLDTLLTMDGPLDVERALQVGVLLSGALETAHRAGIVHGDLSPSRLVFGPNGEPLLAETGLAPFAVFPGLGALNNPVRYHSPPEVLERTDVTAATDVYSLGTTVYALLAGRAPHQKPAEITDSNASLLLRILQMPIPKIERPDLPPGLEDALRGPLSHNPSRRPQRAIEVAWLLQDVQRRAGYAVTEPVVLDLDGGGAQVAMGAPPSASVLPAAGAAGAAGFGATAFDQPAPPFGAPPQTEPAADPWMPVDAPAAGPPAIGPAADPWMPVGEPAAGMSPPVPAADPMPGVAPGDGLPRPTIFPFAEGGEAASAPGSPAGDAPAGADAWPATASGDAPGNGNALWSGPADDAAGDSLWPSSWPADQPQGELPAWAAPPPAADPPSDPPADRSPAAAGGDGGSIGDVGNGSIAMPPRPPELDRLPAWYTDPLPNSGGGSSGHGTNGHGAGAHSPDSGNGAWSPAPAAGDPWGSRPAGDDAWPGGSTSGSGDGWPAAPAPGGNDGWPGSPVSSGNDGWPGSPAGADDTWSTTPAGGGSDAWSTVPAGGGNDSWSSPPAGGANDAWSTTPPPGGGNDAWPSSPASAGGNDTWSPSPAGAGGNDTWAGGAPGNGAAWPDQAGGRPSGPTAGSTADPWAPAGPAAEQSDERLPGSGDELRSLFGQVVGDPGGPSAGLVPVEPPRALGPADPAIDPLGPPEDRPPIDLSRLEAPLGPAPYLHQSEAEIAARRDRDPDRRSGLPRRHELVERQPTGPDRRGAALARSSRPDAGEAARTERPVPRQVAPDPERGLGTGASAGPPAMPVIVLVAVVAVLLLGVIYLVVSGDEAEPAASDRPAGDESAADDAPTGVAASPTPEGVQLTWEGEADAAYVVTILSPDQPPKALPATTGTSALVPAADLGAGGGRCFTVAAADEDGGTGTASDPACTEGATPEAMQSADSAAG